VRKITGLPAEKLRLNRGYLKTGLPADITVFDPDKIDDLASGRLPEKVDANEKAPSAGDQGSRGEREGGRRSRRLPGRVPGKVTRQELCVRAL
jgi:N-acyl-D-aspartate/D-glutamate deacylase